MKSKELIRILQEIDPSGKIEVCINNDDIYFAERLPACYDGNLRTLIRDDSKKPYYDIIGIKLHSSGKKIKLHTMGLDDVLSDNPDVIVDLSDLDSTSIAYKHYKELVQDLRTQYKEL